MKKLFYIFVVKIIFLSSLYSQNITGTISTTIDGKNYPIAFSTVKLIQKDTIDVLADFDGKFSFQNLDADTYKIITTHQDFQPDTTVIIIEQNKTSSVTVKLKCASSDCDSLKNDTELNIGDITVIEFIEALIVNERKKNEISVLLVRGTADSNWIKKSDVEFLMSLIDSKQDAKCIFNINASLVPKGRSTIGDHAIRLIEVYKSKKEFPDEFLICPKYDRKKRKEIKKWWLLEKEK